MKSPDSSTYVKFLLIPAGVMIALFWILALLIDPVVGDLTRTGNWAENDFGWNAPQPVINIVPNDVSISDPDIVVLGDSFSITDNYWQSVLFRDFGWKTLSYGVDKVGCINNWVHWAIHTSRAKVVVIEVVERQFVRKFLSLGSCSRLIPVPIQMPVGPTLAGRNSWPPSLDSRYLFETAINSARLFAGPGETIRTGISVNVPIRPGCAKFSSRRRDRLLYYAGDERKNSWTPKDIASAIANVIKLENEFARGGKRFIFALVPDKSSVYQGCLLRRTEVELPDISNQLSLAGVDAPDLFTLFTDNANRIVDLYLPDNTHLGSRGYLLMAGAIEKAIAKGMAR